MNRSNLGRGTASLWNVCFDLYKGWLGVEGAEPLTILCIIIGGGGGGLFLAGEDFGRMCDHPFPACAFFFFFSFEVKISSRTLVPLFRPGSIHSGSAS